MKKTSWLDNTITWRKYFKLTGIAVLISMVMVAAEWIFFFGNPFKKLKLDKEDMND